MQWYHYLLISLGTALVLLIIIILIKAATFNDNTDYFKLEEEQEDIEE